MDLDTLSKYRDEIAPLVDISRDPSNFKKVSRTLSRISRELKECHDSKLCDIGNLVEAIEGRALTPNDITNQLVNYVNILDEEIRKLQKLAA